MGWNRRNYYFLFLILFLSLGKDLQGASASSIDKHAEGNCNGTFADCFFGNDAYEGGEFLRHFVAGGRLLLQGRQSISYGALQKPAVCSTAQYANCIVKANNMANRPCTDYNRCKRAA